MGLGKPLLFLGHVVMMSAAFQVFMSLDRLSDMPLPLRTASMSSYLTPSRVLLGLKGSPVLRHFTHGSLNMLAPRKKHGGTSQAPDFLALRCCSSPSAAT